MKIDGEEIGGSEIISNYTMLNTDGELFVGKYHSAIHHMNYT